jgi:hypothetical protein
VNGHVEFDVFISHAYEDKDSFGLAVYDQHASVGHYQNAATAPGDRDGPSKCART